MTNKHKGSTFRDHLLKDLREDDDLVFLHIKHALEEPDLNEKNDLKYLIQAIDDVATARGKTELAQQVGLTRQGLYQILNGESIPSIQNVMKILKVIGMRFSVERIGKTVASEQPVSVLVVAQYAASLMPRDATSMQLQKIIYYSQVESLLHFKKPLFHEKIEAWSAGTVVRELFEKHKGKRRIGELDFGKVNGLSMEHKACVDWAIEKYGKMDGDTLSHLTHLEAPWIKARGNLPEEISRSTHDLPTKSLLNRSVNITQPFQTTLSWMSLREFHIKMQLGASILDKQS